MGCGYRRRCSYKKKRRSYFKKRRYTSYVGNKRGKLVNLSKMRKLNLYTK